MTIIYISGAEIIYVLIVVLLVFGKIEFFLEFPFKGGKWFPEF